MYKFDHYNQLLLFFIDIHFLSTFIFAIVYVNMLIISTILTEAYILTILLTKV